MLYQLGDKRVQLNGEGHFIAPNASVIGDVVMGPNSSVWFSVVIRGDADRITIGERSNIQDGAVLHVDPGFPITLGSGVTIGHKAMIHGCEIGDNSLVGINAVVLNGAKIGNNCLIGAGALVTEGMVVPDNSMVLGMPGKIKKQFTEEEAAFLAHSGDHYVANAQRYNAELKLQD